MREFVSSCGYKPMLPESLGVWNNACDINFELLPNKFVIKTNNATETCIVVRDKQNINYEEVRAQLNDWLKIRYGFDGCQFHYLGIKPCIVAEELLEADDLQNKISPKSLIDYKFFCCSGNPECVWIAYNRNHQTGVDMSIYDMNWNKHPEWLSNMPHYNYSDIDIPKPSCFNDMVEACKSLAANFPEVRIDFYVIGDKPYIGELTFTSGYGFFTPEFYKLLGSKIDVTKVSKDSLAYFKRLKYITLI